MNITKTKVKNVVETIYHLIKSFDYVFMRGLIIISIVIGSYALLINLGLNEVEIKIMQEFSNIISLIYNMILVWIICLSLNYFLNIYLYGEKDE